MSAVANPLGLEPLIAEAKARARLRRLLALGAVVVVAVAAVGTTYGLRASGNSLGLCATIPAGWKERQIAARAKLPASTVLTNFRFAGGIPFGGQGSYDGRWPRDGVMITLQTYPVTRRNPLTQARLRVGAADFQVGGEGPPHQPLALRWVVSHGQSLTAFVMIGAVTPSTIDAANQVLAGARVCSS